MAGSYRLKDYLLCLQRLSPLSPKLEAECVKRLIKRQDPKARRLLEEGYLPRVLRWVAPYRGLGRDLDTLIEIGNRALLRGLNRYHADVPMSLEDYLEEMVIDEVEREVVVKR